MTIDGTIKEILSHAETDYDRKKLHASVKLLLKQQDKKTRHACAEAVIALPEVCETPTGNSAISPNAAHTAIMNCRGGVERQQAHK